MYHNNYSRIAVCVNNVCVWAGFGTIIIFKCHTVNNNNNNNNNNVFEKSP